MDVRRTRVDGHRRPAVEAVLRRVGKLLQEAEADVHLAVDVDVHLAKVAQGTEDVGVVDSRHSATAPPCDGISMVPLHLALLIHVLLDEAVPACSPVWAAVLYPRCIDSHSDTLKAFAHACSGATKDGSYLYAKPMLLLYAPMWCVCRPIIMDDRDGTHCGGLRTGGHSWSRGRRGRAGSAVQLGATVVPPGREIFRRRSRYEP